MAETAMTLIQLIILAPGMYYNTQVCIVTTHRYVLQHTGMYCYNTQVCIVRSSTFMFFVSLSALAVFWICLVFYEVDIVYFK